MTTCNGECQDCTFKVNRESDSESKFDMLHKDEIFFEKECVEWLNFGWCYKRYCNVDGFAAGYILDVKNKRKRDGSGENFVRYSHGLGLIIGENEVMYMATLKNALRLKGGFFVYYFEDGMYGVEVDTAIRFGTVAPSKDHEVYYVPFNLWSLIETPDQIFQLVGTYYTHNCLECKQDSFGSYHPKCYIKRLKKRIEALIDDDEEEDLW